MILDCLLPKKTRAHVTSLVQTVNMRRGKKIEYFQFRIIVLRKTYQSTYPQMDLK